MYCINCKETMDYSTDTGILCSKCGTVLNFKCKNCAKHYKRFLSLQNHVNYYCKKPLPEKKEICRNKPRNEKRKICRDKIRNEKKKFCCDHCDYRAFTKINLARHLQERHFTDKENLNKCYSCKKIYLNKKYYLKHIKICGLPPYVQSLTIQKYLFCDSCKYKTYIKNNLIRHIQEKHSPKKPGANRCSKCGKDSANRNMLRLHSKVCGLPKELMRFSCYHCSYKTHYKADLTNHIQGRHLPQDPNLIMCNNCKKSFTFKTALRKHSRICGQPRDLKHSLQVYCDYCDYNTYHKGILIRHIQIRHLPREPSKNTCQRCNKNFLMPAYLKNHLKKCGLPKVKRFACDICGHKCLSKFALTYHIKTKHLPRDPNSNKCNKCQKCFSSNSYLLKHACAKVS